MTLKTSRILNKNSFISLLYQFPWSKVVTLRMGGVLHLHRESAINRPVLRSLSTAINLVSLQLQLLLKSNYKTLLFVLQKRNKNVSSTSIKDCRLQFNFLT
jgi:hypothetical protein